MAITLNELNTCGQALSALSHWIFASKYFEVAVNTKLILSKDKDEKIEEQRARNRKIVLAIDIIFYIFLAVCTAINATIKAKDIN